MGITVKPRANRTTHRNMPVLSRQLRYRTNRATWHDLALILAILIPACRSVDDNTGTRIVSDSAGVEIVSIRPPTQPTLVNWVVAVEPDVNIGVVSGPSSQELSDVIGAIRLRDGRIVVGNGGTNELRFYGSGGRFLFSAGGDGEGPGEFRRMAFIGLAAGDTIIIHDRRLQRLSLFDPSGQFLDSDGPISSAEMLPYVVGVLGSGKYVSWFWIGDEFEGLGVYASPVRFGASAMWSDSFHVVGTVLSGEESRVRYEGRVTRAFRPFGRETDFAVGGDLVFVLTSSDDSSIRVYDTAHNLSRILRVDLPRQRVDASAVMAWTDSWIAKYSDGSAGLERWWRHGFRETPPPEYVPVFRSLEADKAGNICAERYPLTVDAEPVYWCFSPEGEYLRSIRLPAGLLREGPHPFFDSQLEIGENYVLGVWQDELDVEYVRMYRLIR